jgi:hypothetical protein
MNNINTILILCIFFCVMVGVPRLCGIMILLAKYGHDLD